MSIARSTVVFSPVTTGTASVSVTVPAGSTALLIWGFVDVAPTTVGNATIARFNGIDATLVSKSMPGPSGRPIWVYKVTSFNSLPVTATADFSDGSSNNKMVAAFSIQSTNNLLIEGNAGNVGQSSNPSSSILTAFQAGKVYTALSVDGALASDVTETGGQTIAGEFASGGFLYAGIDEKTPSGGNGSSTTATWTLTAPQQWGEMSVSVREVTSLSKSSSDASISSKLDTLTTNLAAVSTLITTDYNATITAIATQTTGQNTRFTSIDNAVANLLPGVTNTNTVVGTINTNLNSVTTTINTIKTNVDTANTNINNLTTSLNTANTNINNIYSGQTTRFNTIDTNIAALLTNNNSQTTTITGRFNTVDSATGTITTNVNTAISKIDAVKTVVDTINSTTASTNSSLGTVSSNVSSNIAKTDAVKTVVDSISNIVNSNTINWGTAASSSSTAASNSINAFNKSTDVYNKLVDQWSTATTAFDGSYLKGWIIGETKRLERSFTNVIASTHAIVTRRTGNVINDSNSTMATEWKDAQFKARIAYANFPAAVYTANNLISIVGMGLNASAVIAIGADSAGTNYIYRAPYWGLDFTLQTQTGLHLGNPVSNGSTWLIPVVGSKAVFYSSDFGVTWNYNGSLGGSMVSSFVATLFQRMHNFGNTCIHYDNVSGNFVTASPSTTAAYISADGFTWNAAGAWGSAIDFRVMCFYTAESALVAYGWDATNNRCSFQWSTNGGASWTAGPYFYNNGISVTTYAEACRRNVVFSPTDDVNRAGYRWYRSGFKNPNDTNDYDLMEMIHSAKGTGQSYAVTCKTPTRHQHVKLVTGNCVSVDTAEFPQVLDRCVWGGSYSHGSLWDDVASGGAALSFGSNALRSNVGCIARDFFISYGCNPDNFRVMTVPASHLADYVINPSIPGFLMLCFSTGYQFTSAAGTNATVLPPVIEIGNETASYYTRVK